MFANLQRDDRTATDAFRLWLSENCYVVRDYGDLFLRKKRTAFNNYRAARLCCAEKVSP